MMLKYYCTLILLFLTIQVSLSQSFFSTVFKGSGQSRKSLFEKHSDVSFGIGTANYYGDLAPYNRPIQSTYQNIRWNAAFNLTRHFTPHISGRVGLTWARIAGDDRYFQGVPGLEQLYLRNAHFRNDIQELAFTGIYNLIPEARSYRNRPVIIPYLFLGIAILHHNPVARTPLDYVTAGDVKAGDWVSLQPLNTEGQGQAGYTEQPYSRITASIPFGAGVRYKLNKNWDIGFEAGIRYSFTDYLDDVGGNYADRADLATQSSLSEIMGRRDYEQFVAKTGVDREAFVRNYVAAFYNNPAYTNPATPFNTLPDVFTRADSRNSSSKLNDIYVLTSFHLVYHIAPSIKCPVLR